LSHRVGLHRDGPAISKQHWYEEIGANTDQPGYGKSEV
jgi:hypothetical protein